MDYFHFRNRVLFCEEVPVPQLAGAYDTPLFVYSKRTLLHHLDQLRRAFAAVEPLLCYNLKTNPNFSICRLMGGKGAWVRVPHGGGTFSPPEVGRAPDKIG